jgi:hypothetical protein
MAEPNIVTPAPIVGGGATNGQVLSPEVQKFATGMFKSSADMTFATYELSELKKLPKSLFYDGATATGTYQGLFAYYVLGAKGGASVPYAKSETASQIDKITPSYSRNPTAKAIIDTVSAKDSGDTPNFLNKESVFRGQIYNVKDFIFCKNYGYIPNNRMLTLRRFPTPTLDSLKIMPDNPGELKMLGNSIKFERSTIPDYGIIIDKDASYNTVLPVSQAITWFGEGTSNDLNNILGISTGLNWSMEAQDVLKDQQTGDPGLINSPFGDLIKSYIASGNANMNVESLDKLTGAIFAPEKNDTALKRLYLDAATNADGPLSKKIFVNLNSVDKMQVRQRGLSGGVGQFTLQFDYKLTSVGTINTKLLFLDLITNLFSLGADYAQFLAPEIRTQQTNVGLGFPGGAAGYAKSITDPLAYIKDQITSAMSKDNVARIGDAEDKIKNSLVDATNELKKFVDDPKNNSISPTGAFGKSLSLILTDQLLKKIYFQPIMLSGYPVGEWHLVVGNPLNPIAMIGNLVCTNVTISLNDNLGPDDFPTEVTAKYTMEPGRQRHRGDWESMFNRGNGRLYLGELVHSTESVQAWINQKGLTVNDLKNYDNIQDAIYKNSVTDPQPNAK